MTYVEALPMVDNAPQPWRAKALCAQTDPEAFFPDKGGKAREAKAVCRECPVTADCLAWVLSLDTRMEGIFGGTTEKERRKMRPTARDADEVTPCR